MTTRRIETEHLGLHIGARSIPLAYVREGSHLWLVGQYGASSWTVEILRAGAATVDLPNGTQDGQCRLVADPEGRARVLSLFREKYGSGRVDGWFRPAGRVIEVSFGVPADPSVSAPTRYYGWLEAEFDSIAAEYDHHILDNRINRMLRDRSLRFMRATFRPRGRLLEIGCGSGTETLELLSDGHEVLAVDISTAMLETVQKKATARGLDAGLTTRKLRAGQVGQLIESEGRASFQGIYSTYGALNCEPDLSTLPSALHALLHPEGRFVAGVFNRWCAFEMVVYSLLGRRRRAFGRRETPVAVEASRFCVDAFAYSVPEFARLFRPPFRLERVEGVPVVLPPSDHARYVEMLSPHFSTLARWDAELGRHFPFSWLGDHFLASFVPVPAPDDTTQY
ncbi:MAG TPA: methyltransferase domain-containing protein [Thermoplasmata archaeon]|nr:methyltransferase domain-containing protein [Thermoplasmata archaeon]